MTKAAQLGQVGPYLFVLDAIRGRKKTARLYYRFFCPGCCEPHYFECPPYDFNGDFGKPTFSPSLDLGTCKLWLQEGRITFAKKSAHRLAGCVVKVPHCEDL